MIPMVFLETGILPHRIRDGANQGHRFCLIGDAFHYFWSCSLDFEKEENFKHFGSKRGL